MLEIQNISKYYKNSKYSIIFLLQQKIAKLRDLLALTVQSTALYCALGLIKANEGEVLFDGVPYKKLNSPIKTVGKVLDLKANYRNTSSIKSSHSLQNIVKFQKSRIGDYGYCRNQLYAKYENQRNINRHAQPQHAKPTTELPLPDTSYIGSSSIC